MAKKNEKKEKKQEMIRSDLEYYSSSIALEDIEDIDVTEIEIPADMFDDSKDVLEYDGTEETFIDYDVFDEQNEQIDMTAFEGKTEDEIQAMLLANIQNMSEEAQKQESKSDDFSNVEDIENIKINPENKIDLSANLEINADSSTDMLSMFQMTEEETEAQLKNVQNEIENKIIQEDKKEEKIQKTDISEIQIEDVKSVKKENEKSKTEDVFDKYLNSADTKKYVFAVSKECAKKLDDMSQNERDKFIAHAIDLKLNADTIQEKRENRNTVFTSIIFVILTIIIATPLVFMLINWSLESTSASYAYCQKSFEKLFQNSFSYKVRK